MVEDSDWSADVYTQLYYSEQPPTKIRGLLKWDGDVCKDQRKKRVNRAIYHGNHKHGLCDKDSNECGDTTIAAMHRPTCMYIQACYRVSM